MAEPAKGFSAQQLIDGILAGQVPHQVRLFAAQGLLPVSREELIRLQLLLSTDPDPDLAQTATTSLQEFEDSVFLNWLSEGEPSPLEIDLLIRLIDRDEVWIAAARHHNIANETLRILARNGSPAVQDIIITNQSRLLESLELLEDLKSNPAISSVVMRRIREFEEEFIAKAEKLAKQQEEIEVDVVEAHSIEESLASLKSLGGHLPKEETLALAEISDPGIEDEVQRKGEGAFSRIIKMSIKEKVLLAMKGSREERGILINSRNRLVLRAVLASPKLTDLEIERFAASRSVSDEVIRVIAGNQRWLRQYPVVLALVNNPKTPVQKAIRLLNQIHERDMKKIAKDRNVHPVVRRQAKIRLESKKR